MALLFLDSFDHYDTAQLTDKWTALFNSGSNIAIAEGVGRCGTNALALKTTSGVQITKGFTAGSSTIVIGFALKYLEFGSNSDEKMLEIGDGSVPHIRMSYQEAGGFRFARGDAPTVSLLDTTADVVRVGAYYYVEVKLTVDNTVGAITCYVNGASVGTVSGIDTQSSSAAGSMIRHVTFYGQANADHYLDDLYILDSTGATNNAALGDSRVEYLRPTAPGTYQEWTLLGSPTHWEAVNDGWQPDDDTTYVFSSTATQRDTNEYSDTGLPTGGTIYGLQTLLYCRKTDSGLRSIAPLFRISGADYVGTNQNPGFPDYTYRIQVYETSPATAVAWTIAEVNAAEYGVKVTA